MSESRVEEGRRRTKSLGDSIRITKPSREERMLGSLMAVGGGLSFVGAVGSEEPTEM
jgi:preprotein translocase subunit Sss1